MRTIYSLFLILATWLTTKGQLKGFLIDTTINLSQPLVLSKKEIREDVALLLYTIRTGYGLYDYIEPKLRSKVENKLKSLANETSISSQELCKSIGLILKELPDGHLVTISNDGYCLSDIELGRREPSIGKNYYFNTNETSKCWKLQYIKREQDSIPVLSIIKFPSPQSKEWEGFEESVRRIINYKNIIIDLRGNKGGNDKMGYDFIATLNGSGVTSVVEYFVSKQTPAAYALLANSVTLQIQNLKRNKQTVPSYLYENLNGFIQNFNDAVKHKIPELDTLNFVGKLKGEPFLHEHFDGSIYILADAACGSSGETVLEGLKTLKNSIFIGENTAGVVHSRNNGKIVLPNSKVQVQMGTRYVKYVDNRFIEKIGYTPDFIVPKGTDALDFTLKIIK